MSRFERAGHRLPSRTRTILLVFGIVLVSPIVLSIYVLTVVLVGNLWEEHRFAEAVSRAPIPDNTTVIDSQTEFGHLVGNGDHCDIRVVQVLATSLGPDQIEQSDTSWAKSVDRELDRQTLVQVTDTRETRADRRLLHVEWFTLGRTSGGLDTLDPRC